MEENKEGKLTALFDNPATGTPERVEVTDVDREYWNAMIETQTGATLCVHIDNLRGFETFYDNGQSEYHGEAKRDTKHPNYLVVENRDEVPNILEAITAPVVGRVVDGVVIWNK